MGTTTNSGTGVASGAAGVQRWSYDTGSMITGSAVVGANNFVYIPGQTTGLFALDGAQGKLKWSYDSGGAVSTAPALGSGGSVYFGDSNGKIVSLNGTTGAVNWTYTVPTNMGIQASPAIAADGTLYVTCDDGYLYAIDSATGVQKWTFYTNGTVLDATPAIGSDGTIYFGTNDRKLYAIHNDGTGLKWDYEADTAIYTSPAIGSDGTIYFVSYEGILYAVNSFGTKLWSFAAGGLGGSSPIVANGVVYYGCRDGNLYAIDASTGTKDWTYATGGLIISTPAIAPDGSVYFGSADNNLYSVDGSTGTLKWSIPTGGIVGSSPAIGADGAVYFGSYDDNVYAVDSNSISNVYASPSSISGGTTTHGVVQLTGQAGPNGEKVSLQSSSGSLLVPATVMVPAGSTGVSFSITSSTVSSSTGITMTATVGYSSKQTTVTLNPYPISNFYASPTTVIGAGQTTGVIQIAGPAGPQGDQVMLACPNIDAGIPASVTVPAGMTGVSFQIYGPGVGNPEPATITATLGSSSKQATVTLEPYPLSHFYASPATVTGGVTTTGVVQITNSDSKNGTISLQSNSANAIVPTSVTMPVGMTGVSFHIFTSPVSTTQNVTLTATYGPSSKQTTLTLNPYQLSNLYASPSAVVGGTSTHGVVQLLGKAGASGDVVTLHSASSKVMVPATVKVPAGSTGVSFTITTSSVTTSTPVVLTATFAGSTKNATVTLNP